MKKYKVFVTGTSSYGVGEGILKIINESSYRMDLRLFGASNSNLTAFKKLTDKYFILPNANDVSYYEKIKKIIVDEEINILIPGSEAEMLFFSKNRKEIENQLNIDIWVNEYEIIDIFDNKLNAEAFFYQFQINTPKSVKECDNEFPLIVKPIQGKSSEGIFVVRDMRQYKAVQEYYAANKQQIIVQEYIEKDAEYTVSFISLGAHVEMLTMERFLNKGATQYAKIVENTDIEDIVKKVYNALGKELILNLQILKKGDHFYIFEVNPRFSGSSPMRAKLGFNEFDIIFSYKYLKKIHTYSLKKDAYCIRGYEEVIYSDSF